MGNYTQLRFHAELKDLTPRDEQTIRWMVDSKGIRKEDMDLPDHELFDQWRITMLFKCNQYQVPTFQKIKETLVLNTHAEIKNYESEIELFLDWIKPFVKKGLLEKETYAETQYCEYTGWKYYFLDKIIDEQIYEQ